MKKEITKLIAAERAYLRWEARLMRSCREMRKARKIIVRIRKRLDWDAIPGTHNQEGGVK